MMIEANRGLIVEVTDGSDPGYRGTLLLVTHDRRMLETVSVTRRVAGAAFLLAEHREVHAANLQNLDERAHRLLDAIVERAGQPNGGLCLDIWHFMRGGIDFAKIEGLPTSMINSVELDDAAAELKGSLWEDTLFHRLYPGEGSFDCAAFIEAVEQAGFRGVYGVEVINQAYRMLPLREQAERSFKGAMAQFANLT